MAGDRSGALAHIDDPTLLDRIEAGERASHIAQELGVHKSAIYHRFANRSDYKTATRNGTAVRIEELEQEIEDSTDSFTLSRARERGRVVMWRAEREHPDTWGAKGLNININTGPVTINEALVGRAADLLGLVQEDATQHEPITE